MAELIVHSSIHPNDYNVNAFDAASFPKLVASIRERGILEPVKVMPDPAHTGEYLLVDGYHRWKAAEELGIAELPAEIWHITPEESKLRGLQLNYLRGQPVPVRLASLIHDLNATYAVDDLAKMLPWSTSQLRDSLELLKLPADLLDKIESQAAAQSAEAPVPITVTLLGREHEQFEAAMTLAKSRLGRSARRGECLTAICAFYLSVHHQDDAGQRAHSSEEMATP